MLGGYAGHGYFVLGVSVRSTASVTTPAHRVATMPMRAYRGCVEDHLVDKGLRVAVWKPCHGYLDICIMLALATVFIEIAFWDRRFQCAIEVVLRVVLA